MASAKPKGVRTQHPQYEEYAPVWKRARDAAEGERAIHKAGAEYLPKLIGETEPQYKARKQRTPFFGAYWRTISGLKGMLFRKDPQIQAPAGIADYLEDVDMAGNPLDMFAQKISEEVLEVGRAAVLVDYPPVEDPSAVTVAAAVASGLRPSLQRYTAEDIINWKVDRVNNALVLTLVVLKEPFSVAGDEYGHDKEYRYRELSLTPQGYRQRVFKIERDTDVLVSEAFPLMNNSPLSFIPFYFFAADGCGHEVIGPPLEDLLNMNLHHYRVSADYEHGCHFSGLPTPYIAGWVPPKENDSIGVGSMAFKCFDNPQAKMAYAEVVGSFDALRTNLDNKKQEMAVLGARMLEADKTAVESAETQRQRVAGEQSQLGGMAQVLSMTMTKALTVFAEWAGSPGEVNFEINRDYIPAGMTPEELTALVSSWQAGAISDETLFDNLQRGEVIGAETTFEEEQARTQSRTPALIPDMQ
jgi:hypothetical protein